MNQNSPNSIPDAHMSDSNPKSCSNPEETLRLIAKLDPPAGLSDRVHYRLRHAQITPARPSFWSLWLPARRLQYAGAAALAIAVGASTWGVYHFRPQPAKASIQAAPSSNFGTAGKGSRPATLTPIKVPPVPKKKPSASRAKFAPRQSTTASQSTGSAPVRP